MGPGTYPQKEEGRRKKEEGRTKNEERKRKKEGASAL
jgi:hypothetical protein